jgi:RimJ/RimL family protein N-acetyltransferase
MTAVASGEVARGQRVVLREKRLGDAYDDYRWRSDPDLSRFDAARPLAMNMQEFLALYREELLYPSPYRRSLAIEDEAGSHIGNVMYYNIDTIRQEAELGITVGERDRWNRGYGQEAVRLLCEHLLGRLGFRRVHLKTLAWNRRARRAFQKAGFSECGRAQRAGNSFVLMEFRQEWLEMRPADNVSSEDDLVGTEL